MHGFRRGTAAALVAVALGVVGCGGGDDDDASDETTTTEEETTTTEDDTTTTEEAASGGVDPEYTERVLEFASAFVADMGEIQTAATAPNAFVGSENLIATFTTIEDIVGRQQDELLELIPDDEGSELFTLWSDANDSMESVLELVGGALDSFETGAPSGFTIEELGAEFQTRFSAMGDALGAFITASGE